jgi:hypothetical protein
MTNDTVKQLEQNIENSKVLVETGAALERLMSNKDFQRVILTGYFKDEAVRLVHLKADQNMQTPERQASIVKQLDAVGSLSSFLNYVHYASEQGLKSIKANQATITELLEEGSDE